MAADVVYYAVKMPNNERTPRGEVIWDTMSKNIFKDRSHPIYQKEQKILVPPKNIYYN